MSSLQTGIIPRHGRLLLRENIVYVGDELGVKQWVGATTRLIDGSGCTLMPGFIDSHFHMLHGSLFLDQIHFETCFTYEDMLNAIRSFALENPEVPWLTGFGLRYNLGPGLTPTHPPTPGCHPG